MAALAGILLARAAGAAGADAGELLDRIARAGEGVRTIRGSFVQEKHLAMFSRPLVTKGELTLAKPGRLRWEVLEPDPGGFSVDGGKGSRWAGGKAEPFDVSRDPVMGMVVSQLMAWASADVGALKRDYAVELASNVPPTLTLRPTAGKGPVEKIVVRFADDLRHVSSVVVHERDGDRTSIAFTGVVVNGELPPGRF